MNHIKKTTPTTIPNGLGWWNLYFIIKLALFTQDKIDFHPLENFALVAFLLLPLHTKWLQSIRNIISIPIAIWLAHYDSFFPPLSRLWSQIDGLLDFQFSYLVELAMRFISGKALLALFILIVAYYFLNQIFKITNFVIIAMVYFSIPSSFFKVEPSITVASSTTPQTSTVVKNRSAPNDTSGPITDQVLNNAMDAFFESESNRIVSFPEEITQKKPFDILFVSVCSLAWDDIDISGLNGHPIFQEFDLIFDNFTGGTSYSGPALVRLLRASCGQEPHEALFKPASSDQCYLFDNLKKLGYGQNLMLNHNGQFDNFTGLIKDQGHVSAPIMSNDDLSPYQTGFDGSNIYRDGDILSKWLNERPNNKTERIAALYNTISLHDGNHIISSGKEVGLPGYKHRLNNLFDDLYSFFKEVEASKQNVMLVLVPEHGAGMRGDKMQIPGMRDIPSTTVVHTPVAIKMFGPDIKRTGEPYHVKASSSYLALSTFISRILSDDTYAKGSFDPKALAKDLPETKMVAQNSGTTVMEYNGKPYVTLDNKTWEPYPQR